MTAVVHASAFTQVLFANEPMMARSLVILISGMMAKGSCRLRITWLSMSRPLDPSSPLFVLKI
jgi:hypothetical protein